MGKYDFVIDGIDLNTAFGKVLSRVPKGSRVLECGCATGYMTKYLRESLECTVDIVEVDEYAYAVARKYAVNGYCGSLCDPWWGEFFRGTEYDRVLFADVLEHLQCPEYALKNAGDLLKKDGKILVSIPNIGHNDVILNLLDGKFPYTKYGLLDESHIRFWGRDDFESMCQRCGLRVSEIDRVTVPTGQTEQRPDLKRAGKEVLDALKARTDGEVYQWIFTLER